LLLAPAQIPAGAANAPGSSLRFGVETVTGQRVQHLDRWEEQSVRRVNTGQRRNAFWLRRLSVFRLPGSLAIMSATAAAVFD
jgi:hypothetical protein